MAASRRKKAAAVSAAGLHFGLRPPKPGQLDPLIISSLHASPTANGHPWNRCTKVDDPH